MLHLVLIGTPHVEIPKHPKIHHLGFVEDQDKYDAMAAAELLIMPSYLESLSMVALEAWAMGKPVLANAKCDVLQGQCLRSNAGLFYQNYAEFAETLRAIDTSPTLQAALGRNGRMFFERHYAWPVIEQKYVDMLQQLAKDTPAKTMESMPGWFSRRRRTQRPADEIVNALPVGPYRDARTDARPPRSEARAPRPEVRQRSQARPEQHRHPGRPEQPRPPQQHPRSRQLVIAHSAITKTVTDTAKAAMPSQNRIVHQGAVAMSSSRSSCFWRADSAFSSRKSRSFFCSSHEE